MHKVVVLGAGISGLSATWYLSQSGLPVEITILEKSSRAGGCMHTDHTTGFHFEKGPRAFRVDRAPHTLQLVSELKIKDEIVWTASKNHPRYLWHDGALHPLPSNPFSLLFSPIAKGLFRALMTEWRKPSKAGDETVWEFVSRRFNHDVARILFDPVVVGIFGGDIRKISVRSCFPKMKNWEEQYGSLTKGFFASRKEKKDPSQWLGMPPSAFFTFRGGIEELPQAILRQISAEVHYNTEVKDIVFENGRAVVNTDKERFVADSVFCALPAREAGRLFDNRELFKISSAPIAVVNFGYDADVLPVKGFGYLAAVHSQEEILGVVFDSSVFSQHNRGQRETRLTVKMDETGQSDEKKIETALKAVRRHLGISQMPKAISCKRPSREIPQYVVGHLEKMAELKANFRQRLPQCHLVGNYFEGISVDYCISVARKAVDEWKSSCLEKSCMVSSSP